MLFRFNATDDVSDGVGIASSSGASGGAHGGSSARGGGASKVGLPHGLFDKPDKFGSPGGNGSNVGTYYFGDEPLK